MITAIVILYHTDVSLYTPGGHVLHLLHLEADWEQALALLASLVVPCLLEKVELVSPRGGVSRAARASAPVRVVVK